MSCCPTRPKTTARVSAPMTIASSEKPKREAVALSGGHFALVTRDKILPQGRRSQTGGSLLSFRRQATAPRPKGSVGPTSFKILIAFDAFGAPDGAPWWRAVDGANWARLEGPTSDLAGRADHPVVHISRNDARQLAAWAEGCLKHAGYPWGDQDPDDETFLPCNIWQGEFPNQNTDADGFAGTAPTDAFKPNGFGLYNMAGNTCEWTADGFRIRSLSKNASPCPGSKATRPSSSTESLASAFCSSA